MDGMEEYEHLLAPYSENGRTLAGQIKWLAKKGIPLGIINIAIMTIYEGIKAGKTYNNGHDLDQELLKEAESALESESMAIFSQFRYKAMKAEEDNIHQFEAYAMNKVKDELKQTSRSKKIWMVLKGEL